MLFRFLLFSVLVCSGVYAANSRDALMLNLNPDGLKVIAKEVQKRALQDLTNESIPNFRAEGPLGIDVAVSGAKFSVDFDALDLTPAQNRIGVHIAMNRINVHVGKLTLSKDLLVKVGSTCSDTNIVLGKARKIHAMATFNPSVQNKKLKLKATTLEFPIQDNNFEVQGPRECTGVLGTGHIVKWVVNEVLSRASSQIQNKLEEKMAETVPVFEEKLNEVVHQDFPLSIPANPLIPARTVHLATYPYQVTVTPKGLEFHLSIDVSANRVLHAKRDLNRAHSLLPLGAAGVNPELINEFMAAVIQGGTEFIELDESLIPGLSDLLLVDTLAQLLPDLREIPVQGDSLKAKMRLAKAPRFSVNDGQNAVWAEFPEVNVMLQVKLDGAWRDYFQMNIRMVAGAVPGIEQGDLTIALAEKHELKVTGDWAPQYKPRTPDFDAAATEETGSAILSLLHDIGAFVVMQVPVVSLGDKAVTVISPHVNSPFIKVNIVSIED